MESWQKGRRDTGQFGHLLLHYKHVCKRDMKAINIITNTWEKLSADSIRWKINLTQCLKAGEEELMNLLAVTLLAAYY